MEYPGKKEKRKSFVLYIGKYTIDKSLYTKINTIEKSGQDTRKEKVFILYI